MKNFARNLFLFWMGASIYLEIELLWRGYSYWTMFFTGGLIFLVVGALNECLPWEMQFFGQALVGTLFTTGIEFIVGMVFNVGLGWDMWDYSQMPLNLYGQICVPYMFLWFPLICVAIIVDDVVKWKFFGERRPHYWFGNKEVTL